MVDVKFKKLDEMAVLPAYAHPGDVGMDLRAILDGPVTLRPFERILIHTGLAMELPEGYEAQIRTRSGLALKHAVVVLNSPATIEHTYRGEVGVILINLSNEPFTINPNERVAQLVIKRCETVNTSWVEELSDTERGTSGFGSSGLQ